MREIELHAACELVLEEYSLLVDQKLGIAVVAHRNRKMHPWPARNEVGAEYDAALAFVERDLGQHQTGRVPVRITETHLHAERRRAHALHALEASRCFEQRMQLRNERRAVARMRIERALPAFLADDVGRVRE